MQIVHAAEALHLSRGAAVTIGNFDGVHKGHQALMRRVLDLCRRQDLACVIVTFWPHPRLVVAPRKGHAPLTSREQRMELLAGLGIEHVLEIPFTPELAALSPEAFVRTWLMPVGMRQLVVGHDFSLGRDRSGTMTELTRLGQCLGFGVEQLAPVVAENMVVSSTRVRECVRAGDVGLAARLLGRRYGFSGAIVHGEGRGNGLGYPTANLLPPQTLLPAEGVYATAVRLDERWHQAVTNIGRKPTFGGNAVSVESFLLDVSGNFYERHMRLEFVARLRGEQCFASAEALTAQIGRDVARARAILATEAVGYTEPVMSGAEKA